MSAATGMPWQIYDPAKPYDPNPLRIDHRTGAVTWGGGPGWEGAPMPWIAEWRLAAPLTAFQAGVVVRDDSGKPTERRVVALSSGEPIPQPDGGAAFGQAGARAIVAVGLYSIDEPGFALHFEASGKHSTAAVNRLMDAAIDHAETADGRRGFLYPVIIVRPDGQLYSHGIVRFFGFKIVDWLHEDGRTLLCREASGAAG